MTHDKSARRRGLAPLRLACARLRCASPLRQPDGPLAQGCALCPECDVSKWRETGDKPIVDRHQARVDAANTEVQAAIRAADDWLKQGSTRMMAGTSKND